MPALPAMAVEMLARCRSDGATLEDLVEVLSTDEIVSERLLEFANSALLELGTSVSTLERASLVLGMRSVQILSLTVSLASHLPHEGGGEFDLARFWQRSLVRAVAGRTLAAELRTMTDDEAFLCGMLGEIGQLVLAEQLAEEYGQVLEHSGDDWPTRDLEQRLLGYDHSEITAAIFEHWQLPTFVRLAHSVAAPHPASPEVSCEEVVETGRILVLAEHITELVTRRDPEEALERLEAQARDFFGMTPCDIDRLLSDLHTSVRTASAMLGLGEIRVRPVSEVLSGLRHPPLDCEEEAPDTRPIETDPRWMRARADTSLRDAETGLPNQEAFELALAASIDGRLASSEPPAMGLVLLAPDPAEENGPDAERALTERLAAKIRGKDLLARLSDGVFAILPLSITAPEMRMLTRRLRHEFQPEGGDGQGPASGRTFCAAAALVESPTQGADAAALLARARLLLESARAKGADHWIHSPSGSCLGSETGRLDAGPAHP